VTRRKPAVIGASRVLGVCAIILACGLVAAVIWERADVAVLAGALGGVMSTLVALLADPNKPPDDEP
jgi:uncharacterized membrane protein YkgB